MPVKKYSTVFKYGFSETINRWKLTGRVQPNSTNEDAGMLSCDKCSKIKARTEEKYIQVVRKKRVLQNMQLKIKKSLGNFQGYNGVVFRNIQTKPQTEVSYKKDCIEHRT